MTEPLIESSEFVEIEKESYLRADITLKYDHFQRIAEKPENKDYRFKIVEYLQKTETEKIPIRERLFVMDVHSGKTFGFKQEIGDAPSIHEKNVLTSKAMAELDEVLGNATGTREEYKKNIYDSWYEEIFQNANFNLPTTLKGVEESLDSWARVVLEDFEIEEPDKFTVEEVKAILRSKTANLETINMIKSRNEQRDAKRKEMREEYAERLLKDEKYVLCNTKPLKMARLQEILEEDDIQFFRKREDIPYIIDRVEQLKKERNKLV